MTQPFSPPEARQLAPPETGGPVPQADVSSVDVEGLERELKALIEGEVRFDKLSRVLYSTDASVYQIEPLAVVVAKSPQDVMETVQICGRFRCPVTARGGGTSQAGQAVGGGIQLDTSKYLNRVLEVNVEEGWVRVQPGVVLDELNAHLRPFGLHFAPDVSTSNRATVGGMIANNSSGAHSVIYGKTIDHVLELHVVLADGSVAHLRPLSPEEVAKVSTGHSLEAAGYRVVRQLAAQCADEVERRFPKILRRVGGYNLDALVGSDQPLNLCHLMVGSEGTLGIVMEAKLKLVPLPKAQGLVVIHFQELLEALAAVPAILEHHPAAIEVLDRFILDHTRHNVALQHLRSFVQGDPEAILIVEFFAEEASHLPEKLQTLEADLRGRHFGYYYHRATDSASQARVWALRKAALGLSMAMKGDAKALSFVEDTAVAPEQLRDYIDRFLQIVHRHGTRAGVYAHASVGCLHVRPVINLKTEGGVKQFEAIANEVADLVLEYGGALSGEHGDGLVRSPFNLKMFGPVLYEAFRAIKRTLDPLGILNPGKIVDPPPVTANLRYGPGYATADPSTFFDFREYGGLGRAVEMCSGLGACRKKLEGTMCPSYMATLEEAHTTRGRANVLRLAMSGRLGEARLTDDEVLQVLKLCLECRACKSECPVSVDMARYKSEFLAGYWARNRIPLRVRALGNIRAISHWASLLAPLSNWTARNGLFRWTAERTLGLDSRRRLPQWQSQTLERWFAVRKHSHPGSPDVILFNDTFTNYFEPRVGIAAVEFLEALGIGVELGCHGCCGRPLISQGLLRRARQEALLNVELLFPFAVQGKPILFCEPSCLSAMREDIPALLRGEARDRAETLARSCLLFEEFVEQQCQAGKIRLELQKGPAKVLLHGHCHQKAMGLLAPAKTLLLRLPGCTVVDLDAGCCGMAGSFGYLREHYEVSRKIAEHRLLPAVRNRPPDALVVATGTSCRHQLKDLAGEQAVHPAELLRASLKAPGGSWT